jgi:TRAP transporter 4TM/12TM fusion protein
MQDKSIKPESNEPLTEPVQDESIKKAAQDLVVMTEAGARNPRSAVSRYIIIFICLAWSGFQLMIAYDPINSQIARAWHLAFAMTLAFLAFPAYKQDSKPIWVSWTHKVIPIFSRRTIRKYIPVYDWIFAILGAASALYIWWDYENLIYRQGMPNQTDIIMGVILIILLLEAARRTLGPALTILAGLFLIYNFVGPYLPAMLRHRGLPVDFIISDMYLTTTGIFGVPLGVSTSFVFLFVLFGSLLDKAGGGKYFIDVAFSALGTYRGGPAKAAVMASGLTGMVSGSSIANTVTTGTFTIPLMKKVGFPAHKAAAVEVASSVNGQLMPPIMGAAAFIMAEIIGIPYLDVVRAAIFPALISYLALLYVVHIEALKMGVKAIPRGDLPKFWKTTLKGCHFLIPLAILIIYLVILRRSPVASALFAVQSLMVIMLVQRPIIAFLSLGYHRRLGTLDPNLNLKLFISGAFIDGFKDLWNGVISGARNMISVGIATATAGIIVGVVTITGLVSRFVNIIDIVSMGNVTLMLVFTAFTSLILGMGMPTTANYIIMATLTAPVILTLGADAGLILPIIAIHLFVFYFGIMADVTPPVGLASYAGAAISRSDPIKTGVQAFYYSLRIMILPFIFLFNTELLMIGGVTEDGHAIWIDNYLHIGWIFFSGLIAMFSFASALQGYLVTKCSWFTRLILLVNCMTVFRPGIFESYVPMGRIGLQIIGVGIFFAVFFIQKHNYNRKKLLLQRS